MISCLIKVCRLFGKDFVVLNRKKIGGELLDLNYQNLYERNKANLLKEVKVFGMAFMGDGATIYRMPHEHSCHEWRDSANNCFNPRLFEAHGGGREEGCVIYC